MDSRFDLFTESKCFKDIYAKVKATAKEYSMLEKMKGGVLIGLSGGADSVMLLYVLNKLSLENGGFNILVSHINHCIRGEEADRDESFSMDLARQFSLPFISSKIDVPKLAKERSLGLEEAARIARYCEFDKIIRSRNDISCIAVAHNSTDNAETSLFNIMRGTGTKGAAGISAIRDNIIRPLIAVSKSEILGALDSFGIEYVTDSTNLSDDYTRNYIRHEILPRMQRITSPIPIEEMFLRFSENLRSDDSYINSVAKQFILSHSSGDFSVSELTELHDSIFSRVIRMLASDLGTSVSFIQIKTLKEMLKRGKPFCYDLGSGVYCRSECGRVTMTVKEEDVDFLYKISTGENRIDDFSAVLTLSDKKTDKISLNVYKISIQADLSSAIILGDLYIRPKRDGDSVFYGGCTHKLKKLYNDKKIPPSKRNLIPVLCDDKGVVWVPGFGVRDDGGKAEDNKPLYAVLGLTDLGNSRSRMYLPSEFSKQNK